MNMFIFRAAIYRMFAAEPDLTVDTALQRIRREHREELKGVAIAKLEALVSGTRGQVVDAPGPLAEAYVKLLYDELELRGDLQQQLMQVEPADADHARELFRAWTGLDSEPSPRSVAELQEAIAMLYKWTSLQATYRDRLKLLYPAANP
jgi:hypothetical protein